MELDIGTPAEVISYSVEGINEIYDKGLASFDRLKEVFKNNFPGIVSNLSSVTPDEANIQLPPSKEEAQALSLVEHVGYINMRDVRIQVPQGMDANFVTYLLALEDAYKHHEHLLSNLLVPYYQFLAIMVSNRKAITDAHINSFKFEEINLHRESVKKVLDSCYSGSNEVRSTFGQVFGNAKEFKHSIDLMKVVYGCYKKINHSAIMKKANEIKIFLKDLNDYLNDDKLDYLTSDAIRALCNGALCVANELEFLAVTYHRTLTAFTSLSDVSKAINTKYQMKK